MQALEHFDRDAFIPVPNCARCASPMHLEWACWDNETAQLTFTCGGCRILRPKEYSGTFLQD